jgi:gamma-glutamyl-gamma-aminobutyrate hydrolase PuuD
MSRFILGIQWHPEMLRLKVEEQNRIFDAFIEACKAE